MANKQLFAQIGVFFLLGVNVAAYYFLWPNYHSVSSNEGKAPTQDKGAARLMPAAPQSAPPKALAPVLLKDAIPLSVPVSVPPVQPKEAQDQEALGKLFDHIKKDNAPLPQVTMPLDPLPAIAPPAAKFEDPHAPKVEPASFPHIPIDMPPVAIASAMTPKVQPSPWLLSMEMAGTRTQLLAKLRRLGSADVLAEFKIVCDRVEMKAPGGELQALGTVTVVGAGLNASCQRLILPIHETRLVLEEQAQIHHDGVAGSLLRGDRIVWELPARAAPVIAPPVLGLPK